MSETPLDASTLTRLGDIVGPGGAVTDTDDMARYLTEPRALYFGDTPLVLRPSDTEQVSAIMKIATEQRLAVVPQGGSTGLVGGQIPRKGAGEIVISLERLNRVRRVSARDNAMIVEAGVTLAGVQSAAEEVDRLFPLRIGSEGTCQIGGNLATNAGGTAVLAYGNARDLVLGLEVVLADGRVWNGLNVLRKDNTGYALRHVFIGSEGTLGIITAASLKLFPRPRAIATALVGIADPAAAVSLLGHMQDASGGRVTGFELLPRIAIDIVIRHGENVRDPLSEPHPWYVLAELSGADAASLNDAFETGLATAYDAELVRDAAIAASGAQAAEFWRIRELIAELQKKEGSSIKHDVAVPVGDIPAFVDKAWNAVTDLIPGARPVPFGHVGDGNLHFNISQPVGADGDGFLARWDDVNAVVHGVVAEFGGSISAEHGIGIQKRALLARTADPVALELMQSMKQSLDPLGILNPGKVLEVAP